MEKFVVVFEDYSHTRLTAKQIRTLCEDDIESWLNIVRFIKGYAEMAIIKIEAYDEAEGCHIIRHAAVMDSEPEYNWKFPELETA